MSVAAADTGGFDRRLTLPLVLGSVLNPINTSMIAVALVPIGAAFGEPPSRTALLVTSLYVTTAIGQPVLGRLVDLFGPRRLFLAATALVGVAGVVGMTAQSLDWLLVSRVLLGLGTCSAFPAAMYLIRSESERTGIDAPTAVLTLLSVGNQTVIVIGPTLGGLLIGLGGWRLIFGVNLPLSLACLVLGWLRLPRTTSVATPAERTGLRADLGRLARSRPLLATYLRGLLMGTITYAFLYGFVQWLEESRGMGPTTAGLLLLPMSVTAIVVTALVGRRRELFGKLTGGALAVTVASLAAVLVTTSTPVWVLALVTLCVGAGQGSMSLANQNAVYHQAPPDLMGSAAGFLRTAMYGGAILASVLVAVCFGARADTRGLHELGAVVLGCAVLLVVVTLLDPALRRVEVGADVGPEIGSEA